jgi:hypothetical protein
MPDLCMVCIDESKVAGLQVRKDRSMDMSHLGARSVKDRWVLPGAAMGVSAEMIFVTFQMVAAVFVGAEFLSPLGMAGAAVLGQALPEQFYTPEFAAIVGLLIYVIVSAACGAAFGALSAVGPVRRSRGVLLVAATAFGSLLWMVNFTLVSQGALTQFPSASPVVQFIAHTFFFGSVLALMLGVRLRSEEPVRVRVVAEGTSRDGRSRSLDLPRAS